MTSATTIWSARASLYGRLAELLAFPSEELARELQAGTLGDEMAELCRALPYALALGPLPGKQATGEYAALQAAYIGHFEVPVSGRPCPLYAGVYASSRRDAMEELLRFYRHFGLTLGAEAHDLPDSLPTVLEFLQVLAFEEEQPGADRESLRAAARDVLSRHVCRWAAETRQRLGDAAVKGEEEVYVATLAFLERFAQAEVAYLTALVGPGRRA